ncbi:MAG: motility associated factor glycosyltransferase family protein [Candidatus Aureabacteria bacterium]|nr:motility associated factor glycosyltransferase family protein [Candidatus Auribacterota bacterium]
MKNYSSFKKNEKIYNANFQLLQEKDPYLFSVLNASSVSDNIQAFDTKDDVPTISYQNRFIHSRRHPLKEAEKYCQSNHVFPNDFIVLYGYGLGYHVQSLAEKLSEEGYLYVIECNFDILKAAFSIVDQTSIINNDNVTIITGKDDIDVASRLDQEVFWALENIDDERKKILFFNPSLDAIPKKFSRIKDTFEIFSFQKRARYVLGEKMVENLKNNISTLVDSYSISSIKNTCNDLSAILIGAGPSLDKVIPYLKKYKERAFIFSVDSSVKPLYNNGIEPDFVVSVDPKDESIYNFTNIEELSNLVVLPSSSTKVMNVKSKRIFSLIQEFSLAREICGDAFDTKGLTKAGGSVSCIMFDVAAQMGFDNIILAGMDYSFPGWKFYATDTPEFKKQVNSVNRFNSIETMSYDAIRSQKLFFLNNSNGIPVPTYQSLYSYARSMEHLIEKYDTANVYNLFSEGVHLKDTKNIFFEEELEELMAEDIDKQHIFELAKNDDISEESKKSLQLIAKKDISKIEW